MKKIRTYIAIISSLIVTLLSPLSAHASLSPADYVGQGIGHYDTREVCAGGGGASGGGSGQPLPTSIPEYWRNLIDTAAASYPNTDRRVVAAELWIENRGWPDPNRQWSESSAGAVGPWQFLRSTWDGMSITGDPNNPADAVKGAFMYNDGSAGKPLMTGATGDLQADFSNIIFYNDQQSLVSFLVSYNAGGAAKGMDGRTLASFPAGGQTPDYAKMGYWLIGTDFAQVASDNGNGPLVSVDGSTEGGTTGPSISTAANICPAAQPGGSVVYYSQLDPQWADSPYAGTGPLDTIEYLGCGPTSMAIILATLVDKNITPPDVAAVAGEQHGGTSSHQNLINGVTAKWPVTITAAFSLDDAIAFVQSGKGLVWMGGQGSPPFTQGGHLVAMVGVTSDGKITIADPVGDGNDSAGQLHAKIKDYTKAEIQAGLGSAYGVSKK